MHFTKLPPIQVSKKPESNEIERSAEGEESQPLTLCCSYCKRYLDVGDPIETIQTKKSKLNLGTIKEVFCSEHDVYCALRPQSPETDIGILQSTEVPLDSDRAAKLNSFFRILQLCVFERNSGSRPDLNRIQKERWRFSRINCIKRNLLSRLLRKKPLPSPAQLASVIFYDDASRAPVTFQVSLCEAICSSLNAFVHDVNE